LQIFLNEKFLLQREERESIFSGKVSSIKDISKYLPELKIDDNFRIIQQNEYRDMVWQTFLYQPILNFMKANCKVPSSDVLLSSQ
jgi:hypothetical protein